MSRQSQLEKDGILERNNEIVKNDYNVLDEYSSTHEDAIANGDVNGKGTKHGGHTHSTPNYELPKTLMNYSDLDVNSEAGGKYDINGRNDIGGRKKNITINIYNKDNAYGLNSVDTSANIKEGQIIIK